MEMEMELQMRRRRRRCCWYLKFCALPLRSSAVELLLAFANCVIVPSSGQSGNQESCPDAQVLRYLRRRCYIHFYLQLQR